MLEQNTFFFEDKIYKRKILSEYLWMLICISSIIDFLNTKSQ